MSKLLSLILLCMLIALPAQAETNVVADLSEDFVGVKEGFNGARLTVFGVLKSRADVAIVLEGPPETSSVRMKQRNYGLWMNGEPRVIAPMPSFYAVLSSRPISKIVNEKIAQRYALSPEFLPFGKTPHGGGLVAAKKAQKLYQFDPKGVKIMGNKLFRADIQLPANVPIGNFKAHIYEFSNNELLASRTETLKVAQVGINDRISTMAHEKPGLYAVLCLILSVTIGGTVAYMLRRKS